MPLLPFQLSFGARGWLHAGWQGSYYPEDLPEDWRLDFYANEFRQVLVPAEYWQWADVDRTEAWADQVDDGFRFFVEAPADIEGGPPDGFLAVIEPLSDHLGGVLTPTAFPPADGIEVFRTVTSTAPGPCPTAWSGTPNELDSAPPANLITLSVSGTHSPLELRHWCEALKPSGVEGAELLLFLDGAPPSIGDLNTLKQLAELMC